MAQKFERGEDQIKSNDRARVVGGSLELNASNAIRIWILMKVEMDLISRLWEQKQKMAIQILARKALHQGLQVERMYLVNKQEKR